MPTVLSSAQLERLRRDAKKLARDNSIPLNQAQEQLAIERGYARWSLLVAATNLAVKAAEALPVPIPEPRAEEHVEAPSDAARRYLHGDEIAERQGYFFCARCDAIKPAAHFQRGGQHDDQADNFLRFEVALERWERARHDNLRHRHRADDAPNLFAADARAARQAYEASRSKFHKWIETQRHRDDPVGDLATDIMRDKSFPVDLATKASLMGRLSRHGSHVIEALEDAWADYLAR